MRQVENLESNGVLFNADGTALLVARDRAITGYRLGTEEDVAHVCRMVGRELTSSEWRTYAGDYPYRRIPLDLSFECPGWSGFFPTARTGTLAR